MVYNYINAMVYIMEVISNVYHNSYNNQVLKIYNFQYIFVFLFFYLYNYGLQTIIKILIKIKYIHQRKYRRNGGGGDSATQTFLKLNFVFQKSFVEKQFFIINSLLL